jgi:hypothetical protein
MKLIVDGAGGPDEGGGFDLPPLPNATVGLLSVSTTGEQAITKNRAAKPKIFFMCFLAYEVGGLP